MIEASFDRLLDAAIEAMGGWHDFIEEEVERFLNDVEDYDWVTAWS